MRRLDSSTILRVWEAGQGQSPHERALTLLGAAARERTPEQWETVALGQRDGALLTLHQVSFGGELAAFAECPRCAERLELTIGIDALRYPEAVPEVPEETFEMTEDDRTLRFRLPNTADVAAVAAAQTDVTGARRLLAQRCLAGGQHGAAATTEVPDLPEATVEWLSREIDRRDPLAAIAVDLRCPACGHPWVSALDIGTFLWEKVSAQAKRLLREVDTLARAYGWSEAEILGLSPWRRQCYMELVHA